LVNDASGEDALLLGVESDIACNVVAQLAKFNGAKRLLVDLDGHAETFHGFDEANDHKVAFLMLGARGRANLELSIRVGERHALSRLVLLADQVSNGWLSARLLEQIVSIKHIAEQKLGVYIG